MKDTPRLVLIEWVDSYGCSSSWAEMDAQKPVDPMICRSAGWILYEDDSVTVIVPHVADVPGGDKQGCGDMTIPTRCITSIVDLGPKDDAS